MQNQELLDYRTRMLNRILAKAQEFTDTCNAISYPFAPLETDGWNTHQVAVHMRDVQVHVYGLRARRTVMEDRPVFPNFDGDAWNAEHYDPAEPLGAILDEFLSNVRATVDFLAPLPPPAWARLSRHEVSGEFAMQHWVERMLAHIEEHLATVKK